MPATLPDRQYAAPAAADGVALVLPGVAWDDSNVEELIASADADLVLTGIVIRPVGIIFTAYELEVDILVDAMDPPIATFRAYFIEVNASVGSDGLYLGTGRIGIDAIPAGSSLSARLSANTTETDTIHVSATYLKKPLTGTLLTTTNPLLCYPSRAANVAVFHGGSWATGTAVELFDDSGPARAIVGVVGKIDVASVQWELDLCTGEGHDVVTTSRGSQAGVSSFANVIEFPHPLQIPAATSLSAQSRGDDVPSQSVLTSIAYFEMPL